eukprot:103963_1
MIRMGSSVRRAVWPVSHKIDLFKIPNKGVLDVQLGPHFHFHMYWPQNKDVALDRNPFQTSTTKTIANLKKECDYDYDLIIACDRLRDLNPSKASKMDAGINGDNDLDMVEGNDGWDVSLNPTSIWNEADTDGVFVDPIKPDKENYNIKRVAVTGIYNVGKTYILRNLCSMRLPDEGNESRTKGLSIKQLPTQPDVLVMDSAGKHSIIEMADTMSLSDKISSEKILENTIYDLANYHICVVNELTWPDQHHFEMLYDKIQRSRKELKEPEQQWPLLIIHNFKDKTLKDLSYVIDQVEASYKDGIFRCSDTSIEDGPVAKQKFIEFISQFRLEQGFWQSSEQAIKQLFKNRDYPNFWFDSKANNTTKHFFLVQSNDRAGAAFNFFVFEYIRNLFISAHTNSNSKPFCLNDIFKALDKQTRRYVKFRTRTEKAVISTGPSIESNLSCVGAIIKYNPNNPNNRYKSRCPQQIKLIINPDLVQDPNDCSWVKLRRPDELDYNALYAAATEWIPKYDIQYLPDGETCNIFMEIPGKLKDLRDVFDEEDRTRLIISGKRVREDEYVDAGENDTLERLNMVNSQGNTVSLKYKSKRKRHKQRENMMTNKEMLICARVVS